MTRPSPTYAAHLFPESRLAAADFDQTIAHTFSPAPSGIGVHEAYATAIDSLYGQNALDRYQADGGFRNRAAAEVVGGLFPDMPADETAVQAQRLIDAKLAIMLDQIDERWPQPTAGFVECWNRIEAARQEASSIDTAVISSGYKPFIRKTFDVWGLPGPDILVTNETVSGRDLPEPADQRYKPAPLSMRLALEQWVKLYGAEDAPGVLAEAAKRIVYIGDDPVKDGKLAEHFGIPFVLLSPDRAAQSWAAFCARLGLGALSLQGIRHVTSEGQ